MIGDVKPKLKNGDPFCTNIILKTCDLIESGDLSDAENAVFTHYVDVWAAIRDQIKIIANGDLEECARIVDLGYGKNNPYAENGRQKGDTDFIQYHLGVAMMTCDSGLTWAWDREMMIAIKCLMTAKSILDRALGIEENLEEIEILLNRYKKGPKIKAEKSKQNWELARQYFSEEIPNHKTLMNARKAAAKKAGITVNERRLIEMLPVEK